MFSLRVIKTSLLIFTTSWFFLFNFSSAYAQDKMFQDKKISHNFYITANTGSSENNDVLQAITLASKQDDNASLLLLGNITGQKEYPQEKDLRENAKNFLSKDLLDPIKEFNGKIIITPGKNEWNKDAPQSIDDLESFLQDNSNTEFWPDDGCPIESEAINDLIELVSVDSQWFLEDWDSHSQVNSKCDYKTREEFFAEFKDALKDSHGKIIIVAVHHPVMSNNVIPFFRRVAGTSPAHFENSRQRELRGRLETLASLFDDVIFVSGNHHNLQFLQDDHNPQIISGATGSTQKVKTKGDGLFSSSKKGYAKLTVFEDGTSVVQFFELDRERDKPVFVKKIQREHPTMEELDLDFSKVAPGTQVSSIYTSEETAKSGLYRLLWGDRHRKIYSRPITAPVLYLDSLHLKPISEGGGQQSRSLRLINKNEYTLRALRKDPIQYLQADVVKTSYIEDFAKNTIAERYISDFFTTAHPYAPFAVNDLMVPLKIPHANPEIYFVPKQPGLDIYNESYGDALFMLEEHVGSENKEFKTFGSPEDILSTTDLILELQNTKDSYVDQEAYLRSRLFDMLIGDWDRHQDQWRWAQHSENGKKRYVPIPRDRDHAFPKYDGLVMPLLKAYIPELRKMQSYEADLENIKWFNVSGYPLDQFFITNLKWEDWEAQARFIQKHLTDERIEQAFSTLPKEIKEKDLAEIKESLRARRDRLVEISWEYYQYFLKFQTLVGTEEDDKFEITRKPEGITEIIISKEGEEYFRKSYSSKETGEIWIYGLDGEDRFVLSGEGDDLIRLKILGGIENDIYAFTNTTKAKIFDYKSAENKIMNPQSRKWLVDSYEINQFNYKKVKYSSNKLLPIADWVSDAGLTVGLKNVYTTYGLKRNPFSSQFVVGAQYFFASQGYQLNASAEFGHLVYNWNLKMEGLYSSPNFFINYFGSGNETEYDRDAVEKTYNRVKLEQWKFSPSLVYRDDRETLFKIGPLIESVQVTQREDSFINDNFSLGNVIFQSQIYAGGEFNFNYYNKNRKAFPTLGAELDVLGGYKQNIDGHDNQFGYIKPSLSVAYPLIPSKFAAIATKIGGMAIIGDNFEFYHAATLGGNRSLRGYRNHRFNGKQAFFQSTDLRSAVALLETNFVPLVFGVSAGFDYGRVWSENETSHQWHNNYGGSVWISAALALTANIGFYHGGDGNRLTFTVNFKY